MLWKSSVCFEQSRVPEVKDYVDPLREVKLISRTQEKWSSVHVFFKAVLSKDIRGLVKPWEIDYRNVKIVKHTLDYNGEKITLAMALPFKDGKHVVAYYEFSKPVQGVKIRAYLLEFIISEEEKQLTTKAVTTNGIVIPLSGECEYECFTASDCGPFGRCITYCCDHDGGCMAKSWAMK